MEPQIFRPVLRNFHEIKFVGFKRLVTKHVLWHPLVILGWGKEVRTAHVLEDTERFLPAATTVTVLWHHLGPSTGALFQGKVSIADKATALTTAHWSGSGCLSQGSKPQPGLSQ